MNIVFMSMDTLPSTLWARDLYDQMHIRSDFRKWFPRMCQYGFIEGRDYEYILMLNPVINYVTVAVFAIGFAILGNTKYGYFIAVILGQVLTVLNMKRQVPKRMFCFELKQFQYDKLVTNLAKEVQRLLDNPDLCVKMGEANRKNALQYGTEGYFSRFCKIVNSIIGENR